MGFNANCGKMQCRAGDARATGWEGYYSFFCSSTADLLPAHSGCNARLSKSAGRKPASIGRLRVGRPETLVNRAFTGRQAGNARKHWAGGQPLRKCPFYAGFRGGAARVSAGRWIRRCSRKGWSKRVAADRRCSVFPRSRGGTAERDS